MKKTKGKVSQPESDEIVPFLNNIHLGRWEDVMAKMPSNSVDLIVTSPPYNIAIMGYDNHDDDMPYTEYIKWMTEFFHECKRVLKSGGRIAINIADKANGSIPTHADFIHTMWHDCNFVPITTIVWDKLQMANSTSWGSYQSPSCPSFPTQFEFVIIMGKDTKYHDGDKGKITVSGKDFQVNSRALWKFNPENRTKELGHPVPFPEELPRRLIDQLTYEGDIVLDPFSGSGTTCSVAKRMNRRYIGIDKSSEYIDKSLFRVANTPTSQDGVPECFVL